MYQFQRTANLITSYATPNSPKILRNLKILKILSTIDRNKLPQILLGKWKIYFYVR